jgi:hypothetical protein
MKAAFGVSTVRLALAFLVLEYGAWCYADDSEIAQRLNLADLAGYRVALSGKPTADDAKANDPPVLVVFKDLWNRPDQYRGRRVTIEGRVERIFRQGLVGSFPPLAEVWVTAPAGDPFCIVFPQPSSGEAKDQKSRTPVRSEAYQGKELGVRLMPKLGQSVRFTGTFLKRVSYSAGDGARLAPLVVGDRLPVLVPSSEVVDGDRDRTEDPATPIQRTARGGAASKGSTLTSQSLLKWVLGMVLAAVAARSLLRRHLRYKPLGDRRAHANRMGKTAVTSVPDPPLEFVEPSDGR